MDDDRVISQVKTANAGCVQDREVIRPSTVKEFGNLNVEDFKAFNQWFLEEEKPTFKGVVGKFSELRHHRWAQSHVMALDNPNVAAECSMSFPHGISKWFVFSLRIGIRQNEYLFLCMLDAPIRRNH